MEEMRIMMMKLIDQKFEEQKKEQEKNEINQMTATPARRTLHYDDEIPELTSPLTAVKKSDVRHSKTALDEGNVIPHFDLPVNKPGQNNVDLSLALQKGMAKPPTFTGSLDEDLRTWWRQMKNFALAFPSEARSRVIKSYMCGSAATWLESQERELGRELTLSELADGLVQEYGSETTSSAALQTISSLVMGISKGCDTINGYNTEFSKLYNKLSVRDQILAVHFYIKGIEPKYLKYVVQGDTDFQTLAEAKAAVVQAVAKHDKLQLAYDSHNQQKKGDNRTTKNHRRGINYNNRDNDDRKGSNNNRNNSNKNNNRRWEDTNPYRYSLSSLADKTLEGEDDDDNSRSEGEVEGKDHQIAAVASVGKEGKGDDKRGGRLSKDEMDKLRKEGRCFNCRERGHRSFECKKPKPLNP